MPSLNAYLSTQAGMSMINMPMEGAPVWVLIRRYGSQRCVSSRRFWVVFSEWQAWWEWDGGKLWQESVLAVLEPGPAFLQLVGCLSLRARHQK